MTATTVDRAFTAYPEAEEFSFPVAASTKIPEGALVFLNSSGYAVNGTTTAGEIFVGYSVGMADNSAVATNGAINVRVRRKGVVTMVSSNLAITDVGKDLFVADNQTLTLTPGNNYVGKLAQYTSATEAMLDVEPALNRSSGAGIGVLCFSCPVVTGVSVTTKFEFPRKALIKRLYATCTTAPGGTDTLTCLFTDGTTSLSVVITGAATEAEDETGSAVPFKADTDCTVTFTRTGSTAAGGHLFVTYQLL